MQAVLNTRLDVELAQALKAYAAATGQSQAAIIGKALREYLEKQKQAPAR